MNWNILWQSLCFKNMTWINRNLSWDCYGNFSMWILDILSINEELYQVIYLKRTRIGVITLVWRCHNTTNRSSFLSFLKNELVCWIFSIVFQEPWGFRERAGRSAGCPGGLPGFSAAGPRLLHWHLGLSVLPRHCKLPVFLTEGEYLI